MAESETNITTPPAGFLHNFSFQPVARRILWSASASGQIASSYLFAGPRGSGKLAMALEFVRYLKCTNKNQENGKACGECFSCRAIASAQHPDVRVIVPAPLDEFKKNESYMEMLSELVRNPYIMPVYDKPVSIPIDIVRDVRDWLGKHPSYPGGRFAIIVDAHTMRTEAANAFLKTLEEPLSSSHIILLTPQIDMLLTTIRSRAQKIPFFAVRTKDIANFLTQLGKTNDADTIASQADGSLAEALSLVSGEQKEAQQIADELLAAAKQGTIGNLLERAQSFPASRETARRTVVELMNRLHSRFRNSPTEPQLVFLRQLDTLYNDIRLNPQYSLFWSRLSVLIYRLFRN